jgi:hypothetical protein
MRRDGATTAQQKAPRLRWDHKARKLANPRRQSNRQHDTRNIPLSVGLGIQVANQAFIDQIFSVQNPLGRRVNGGGVKSTFYRWLYVAILPRVRFVRLHQG